MNLYKELTEIFPYLISIRKLETYLSIDIEFPLSWKYPKKYIDEKMVVELKTEKSNVRCFSFATSFSEETLNIIFSNLKNIINYNKEREEKEKLFELKVKELKDVFDKQTLTELKDLEFQVKTKMEIIDDERQTTSFELVSDPED